MLPGRRSSDGEGRNRRAAAFFAASKSRVRGRSGLEHRAARKSARRRGRNLRCGRLVDWRDSKRDGGKSRSHHRRDRRWDSIPIALLAPRWPSSRGIRRRFDVELRFRPIIVGRELDEVAVGVCIGDDAAVRDAGAVGHGGIDLHFLPPRCLAPCFCAFHHL